MIAMRDDGPNPGDITALEMRRGDDADVRDLLGVVEAMQKMISDLGDTVDGKDEEIELLEIENHKLKEAAREHAFEVKQLTERVKELEKSQKRASEIEGAIKILLKSVA